MSRRFDAGLVLSIELRGLSNQLITEYLARKVSWKMPVVSLLRAVDNIKSDDWEIPSASSPVFGPNYGAGPTFHQTASRVAFRGTHDKGMGTVCALHTISLWKHESAHEA